MAPLMVPRRFVSSSLSHFRIPSSKIGVRVGLQNSLSPSLLTIRARSRYASNSMSQPSSDASTVADSADVVKAADSNDVLVQYVVLRRDLIDSWPLGSVVTQGCHASVAAVWANKDDALTAAYCSPDSIDSMHKVTLEVKGETQILNLSEKLKAGTIAHKLWIEQPENIPTCLATKPYPKSVVSPYFKKLKLCK